jgi:DNA mismatch endonuclease (patch repair protein)
LAGVRRTADIVFPRQRIAVFIDGCFWHSCPEHGHPVSTNPEYWDPKLARNRERDLETTALLEANGWVSLRFWAHENPSVVADRVEALVNTRRRDHGS